MNIRSSLSLSLVVASVCLATLSFAAKPTPTATPKPTATPAPTATPTPAPTATATPTATPKPTATPTATPVPTATPSPSPYCPLPLNYGLTSTSSTGTSSSTNSPEKPGPLKAVCHHPTPDSSSNYIILCVPPSAYNAHIQHGDTALPNFTCTKAGNQGPCTQ